MADEQPAAPVVVNGVPPTGDVKMDATNAWMAAKQAERAAAKPAPEPKPAPKAEAAEAPAEHEAPPAEPATKASKALAAKLAGKEAPKAGAWDESATRALSRAGLKDTEMAELAEKPWAKAWIEKLQRVQEKQDADYAALKAAKAGEGTREPTPGARSQSAQEQGDQPGSGKVADLLDDLTKSIGLELGDENATKLRQVLDRQDLRLQELQQKLDGYTRSVAQEREAAEIEAMVQRSRSALREEFSWIDDEERFEAVATELAGMRPSEISQAAITEAMRKAARVVGYDDLKADAQAVASKLDTKRKTRLAETAPGGSTADTDEPVLDEFEISLRSMRMQSAGEPKERISRWVQNQHERRRKANQR